MSGSLSWRAIGFGTAVIVATTIALTLFGFVIGPVVDAVGITAVLWGMRVMGLAGDFAGGFVAGRIAGRDGAIHGVVAGAIGAGIGLLHVMVRLFASGVALSIDYWLPVLLWTAVGVALAFVGGALGAQARQA